MALRYERETFERVVERGRGIRGAFGVAPRDVAVVPDESDATLADPERASEGGDVERADGADGDVEAQSFEAVTGISAA
jgi:hypothetical protein